MSIQGLVNPSIDQKLYPIFVSSINGQSENDVYVNLPSAVITAQVGQILRFHISGILLNGTDQTGIPKQFLFYWNIVGGVLGTMTVRLKSSNQITVYAEAVLNTTTPVYPTPIASMINPLPTGKGTIDLIIDTDSPCNSSIIPLALEIIY